jgi:hypothetical protein
MNRNTRRMLSDSLTRPVPDHRILLRASLAKVQYVVGTMALPGRMQLPENQSGSGYARSSALTFACTDRSDH